jgi:hypothetical protein
MSFLQQVGSSLGRACLFCSRWTAACYRSMRQAWLGEGVLSLLGWSILLILGTWFPSTSVLKYFFEGGPLPSGLGKADTLWASVGLLLVAGISWTWTNLALICLASAYLGIAARDASRDRESESWRLVLPRAFVIYLACLLQEVFLMGGLIPSQDRLTSGDAQQHYVRLAVLCSLVCFATSFRPQLFEAVLDGILGRMRSTQTPEERAAEKEFELAGPPKKG